MTHLSGKLHWLMAGALSLIAGLLLWGMEQQQNPGSRVSARVEKELDPTSPVVIRGISYRESKNDGTLYALKASVFKIKPRDFGIFSIQPIKETLLADAIIDIYLPFSHDKDGSGKLDIFPSMPNSYQTEAESHRAIEGIGLITRGVINNLSIHIYHGDQMTMAVTARKAVIHFFNQETVLEDANIEHKVSRRFVTAQTMLWDGQERVFKIPGQYKAATPKRKASGYGIKVNLVFKVTKMS
ncbi:MAG: hypothetical protein CSYNP_03903 [Syntrophus sp. SKADARSKE-3]|nr:hypothetical protein [Syntrophus sp. SKADARSKE-3]